MSSDPSRRHRGNRATVSVVIPVYNAVDHLPECLQSIIDQSIGFENLEIIAVDDGSTDGSSELLDAWAQSHRDRFHVLHQENSGAPGGPRNRGIELAKGDYLFFADPDDFLGIEALERMVAAAERNDSDVVLGKIKGIGRKAPETPFRKSVEGGDIFTTHAIWSLTAHKLFRRSMVEEHGLRFAENVRLAEEQVFVVPAYLKARSISVVSDYDCYYLVRRDDFPHLTHQVPDPVMFYSNLRNVLEIVRGHVAPGPQLEALLNRWLRLEILGRFDARFTKLPAEVRNLHVKLAGELLREYFPQAAIDQLAPLFKLRCQLIAQGQPEELTALTMLLTNANAKRKSEPLNSDTHTTKRQCDDQNRFTRSLTAARRRVRKYFG
ncbi:glycosyltransferase family 2 protein [Streptomyces anthocyanicus]|uniref:glycosyltransferase family 2 protein n=1 Tax=Streptomyces TaxID=1883 RepID=UPI0029AE6C0B|nr:MULTISPECIES: glycosyltransferase family 2 protein [Streptomyces]MDX3349413.1 glycosyltransferase family 2 protein [Streptomyces sp. ME02-6979A]